MIVPTANKAVDSTTAAAYKAHDFIRQQKRRTEPTRPGDPVVPVFEETADQRGGVGGAAGWCGGPASEVRLQDRVLLGVVKDWDHDWLLVSSNPGQAGFGKLDLVEQK